MFLSKTVLVTSVQSPLPPLQNTPTYHIPYIQLYTRIYLKQHTGPLDVSREVGASTSQVERTPGRATLTYWVVEPLHCYSQEGWVDNNNMSASGTFAAGHSSEMGLYEVLCDEYLPGLGIGMTNEVF